MMNKSKILLGDTVLNSSDAKVEGAFVEIEGEKFYKICNYSHMDEFFMTIVSDSNHWMFISSNGALSAGRKDRDNALFPYYTDDKIHDYAGKTGSSTSVLIENGEQLYLWEPFSKELSSVYNIERNIYKSIYGNKLIFEEINFDLNISFSYGWYNSDKYGFVKKSKLSNLGNEILNIEILDGLKNILPSGLDYAFQNEYSNLLDGYKKSELINDTELGLFMLSSIPVDRAEPSESLTATTVWSAGLNDNKVLLSEHQVKSFKQGLSVSTEYDIRASRGSFYVSAPLNLKKGQSSEWLIVAEINQSSKAVANLNQILKDRKKLEVFVQEDVEEGTKKLIKIVAAADGMQISNEALGSARHFSNTLFNVMRGGIYMDNYQVEKTDFLKFAHTTNKSVSNNIESLLEPIGDKISIQELSSIAEKSGNADFVRICHEYLPLTFSRRHGDPSRPWNLFSIDTKNEDGTPKSDYQGNWRDIFQNWEALSLSYPEFVENIIAKFVNASTPDGYNPYRIMRNGIDWECPDPDDPWAYIGYWGDHQIIYLQKLCELSDKYHPGKLDELLTRNIFGYANVPYRIKDYYEIVKNPQDTIVFDADLNRKIDKLVGELGADGRLILNNDKSVYYINLTEKILVSVLSKLSNFIPEAGIWLNTQRPEWNDANNALVGSGVSMVTLYYIRRFLQFWKETFQKSAVQSVELSQEVKQLFVEIFTLLDKNASVLATGFSDEQRRFFTDRLGEAGEKYRNAIYTNSFSGKKETLTVGDLVDFTEIALKYIDQSIKVNKREDGLYHSYNLVAFTDKGISIRYLYEMLEGQVAVLSAGSLSVEEGLNVLDSLKSSALFREDQYSYILYPDRQLPRFEEKNNIPTEKIQQSKLLRALIENNNSSVVQKDDAGGYHFNESFRNAEVLEDALNKLEESDYNGLIKDERQLVLDIYEELFDHQSFTGRSGTFYAYEGLGSIYWHMVSKLLLAAEEYFFMAIDDKASDEIIGKLKNHYYEIKAGIGLYKSPELYGAFPTDAYSHTPGGAGVKQPGMTGQVKEDVISRMGELGVRVLDGQIHFDSSLLNKNELLSESQTFTYIALDGTEKSISLSKNQLAFTICQVPVIYSFIASSKIMILDADGKTNEHDGNVLITELSNKLFNRTGEIVRIDVSF